MNKSSLGVLQLFLDKQNCSASFQSVYQHAKHINEPRHDKTCLCYMRITKTQIKLRIRAFWSAPLLFTAYIVQYLYLLNPNFQDCSYSHLVANPRKKVFSWRGSNQVVTKRRWELIIQNNIWASSRENLSLGFATRVDSNRPVQLRSYVEVWNFGYRN